MFFFTGISADTGMCPHDIASTLQELYMIDSNTADDVVLSIDSELLSQHQHKMLAAGVLLHIDEDCLRWTPVVSTHNQSSPASSPDKSVGAVVSDSIKLVPHEPTSMFLYRLWILMVIKF